MFSKQLVPAGVGVEPVEDCARNGHVLGFGKLRDGGNGFVEQRVHGGDIGRFGQGGEGWGKSWRSRAAPRPGGAPRRIGGAVGVGRAMWCIGGTD